MKIDWIKNKIRPRGVDYWSLFIIFTAFYWRWQKNPTIGDPDGFYHAKITDILSHGQILHSLPWMQTSTLVKNFTDHHFLYHALLTPLVRALGPLWGVKISAVLFATSAVLVFYWLLKKLKINYSWWLSLFIITLPHLNLRWSLIKSNSLSFILCIFLIYSLIKNKPILSAMTGFLFVWLYGGWPIIFPILLSWIVSIFIFNRTSPSTKKNKHYWPTIYSLIGGVVLGLISHPYWPKNLYFYWQQVVQIGIINLGDKFTVGSEWYGSNFFQIFTTAPHLFIFALLLLAILIFHHHHLQQKTIFSLLMTFGFLVLTVKSSRQIEYLLPFLLLFITFALDDLKCILSYENLKKYWQKINIYLKAYLISSLAVLIIFSAILVLHRANTVNIPHAIPLNRFAKASTWIQNNTEQGAIIFHDDWDQWPMLFYHNQNNYYLIGLDPTFMYNFNPNLHQLYLKIISGEESDDLAIKITKHFHSNYVFLEKINQNNLLETALIIDQNINLAYEDEEVKIYQIKN
jgi:hypothetical protein